MKEREGGAQSHILQNVYVVVSQRGRVREANRRYLMREKERGGRADRQLGGERDRDREIERG